MDLNIEYLKSVIPVGQTKMINSDGNEQTILRASTNAQVLQVAGKFCSWENLCTILNKKGCKLNLKEIQQTIFPEEKKQHGGHRPGAGRKKKMSCYKKKPMSFALVDEDSDHLDTMCNDYGFSRSQMISNLIQNKWSTFNGITHLFERRFIELSPSAVKKLDYYLEGFGDIDKKPSFSEIIERLINDNFLSPEKIGEDHVN